MFFFLVHRYPYYYRDVFVVVGNYFRIIIRTLKQLISIIPQIIRMVVLRCNQKIRVLRVFLAFFGRNKQTFAVLVWVYGNLKDERKIRSRCT